MPYPVIKNKNFSFNNHGYFNQFGLKSVIQDISPKLLRPSEKFILMVASEHATASDQLCIFKSLSSIAEQCGVSKDTVRRCLTRCVEMGLLTKNFVIDQGTGKQKPCLYTYTKRFIWLATAFRRVADKLKSRRQKDFKAALERFNTALQRLVFRAKLSFSAAKRKLFAKGYPPKSALKQGLQNATRMGSKIEPNKVVIDKVNKYDAAGVNAKRDAAPADKNNVAEKETAYKNGAVRSFQELVKKFSSIAKGNFEGKKKTGKHFLLEQSESKSNKLKAKISSRTTTTESFNYARFDKANQQAEQDWKERQRITRENPPEKQAQKLAQLRALLDNARANKVGN